MKRLECSVGITSSDLWLVTAREWREKDRNKISTGKKSY